MCRIRGVRSIAGLRRSRVQRDAEFAVLARLAFRFAVAEETVACDHAVFVVVSGQTVEDSLASVIVSELMKGLRIAAFRKTLQFCLDIKLFRELFEDFRSTVEIVFQEAGAEIFKKLAKEFDVETTTERFSESGAPKHYHEFKYNDRGEKVLHGLTRNFYENGMIAEDCFFRNGRPEGELRQYTELGVPLSAAKKNEKDSAEKK